MQESVKQYAEGIRRSYGIEVAIRVGLNSGEVVVRSIGSDLRMDYTAVGQTTHLAARMEQLAAPGTVRLAGETMRLVEGYVEVKPLGPIPVKGLSDRIAIFELTGAGQARTRLQAAALRGLTRFVGRDADVEHLRRVLGQAGAGHGQVAAIVGEAGVGKSRLTYEFTHSHRVQDWLILEAASVSYGKATSYLPVIDLLKGYFKIGDRDNHREMRDKVMGRVLGLDRALEPLLPPLLALLDVPVEDAAWQTLDAPQRRQRTLDAVKRLLLRESQVQPLLMIFEDLHWIDSETQAFLESLVESLPTARLLLLVNYRPEYQHGWGSKTYYTQLRLDALPRESASELLQALLGADTTVEPLKWVLIARTVGNPLFLEESVRTLVETGALTGERGGHRLVRPLDTIDVPATVQAILTSRIDRLAPEDKQLLQTASVIGKDVPFPLLLALAGPSEDDVRRGLARLQAAEFFYETRLYPDPEYSFKHALTHDVAYGGLLQERRRDLHSRIFVAIETVYRDRLAEHVERLAHHALRAELWDKAVMHLRQAGRRAVQRSAHRMAAAFLEDALTTLRRLPRTRATIELEIDLRLELRVPLTPLGGGRRGLEVMREAQRLATDLDDPQRLALTLCHMIEPLVDVAEMREAIGVGERAFELAEVLDNLGIRVLALRYIARAHHRAGDFARAIQSLRQSLELLGDLEREHFGAPLPSAVAARTWLASCLADVGEFAEGMSVGREALRVAELVDQPLSRVHAHFALGAVHFLKGECDHAITAFEHAVRLVRTWDIAGWFHRTGSSLALAYATAGRLAEALSLLEVTVEDNWTRGNAQSLARLAQGYLLSGRTEDSRATVARALELACAHGERANEAEALRILGECAAAGAPPDLTTARRSFEQALAVAEPRGMRPLAAHCHLGLSKLDRRTDKREQAQEHLATATTMYRDMGMTYWLEKAEAEFGA